MHKSGHYAFSTQETDSETFCWFKNITTYKDVNEDFEQIIIEFVDLTMFEYYDQRPLEPGESTGFIKISLADKWDPEGFIKFEVDLPDTPLIMEDNRRKGFEIIAIWESQIESEGTFYTDSNGVELLKREWR